MSSIEGLPPLPELPDVWYEMTGEELLELGGAYQNPFLVHLGYDKKFIEDLGPVLEENPNTSGGNP